MKSAKRIRRFQGLLIANVFFLKSRRSKLEKKVAHLEIVSLNVANECNQNLSEAQRELVVVHCCCAHANIQWLQDLMPPRQYQDGNGKIIKLQPVLLTKHDFTNSCNTCKCAGCLLAEAKRNYYSC